MIGLEGSLRLRLAAHDGPITSVAVAWDGAFLISASADRTLKLWDPFGGEALHTFLGHTASVLDCAVSVDGRMLVSASADGTLRIWDPASGEPLRILEGQSGSVTGCAIGPDAGWVVSASDDGTLVVWDTASGKPVRTLRGHELGVSDCAVSPDGRLIVSAGRDGTLGLWDPSGERVSTLTGHVGWIKACEVSPDGSYVVSGGEDGTLRLWDPASGSEVGTLEGHREAIWDCAFSPDGSFIVSTSADGTLKLWDPDRRTVIATLQGSRPSCAAGPQAAFVVAGRFDNRLEVWDFIARDQPSEMDRGLFSAAEQITGSNGTIRGDNTGAGKEPGEPDHAGTRGGSSVWFRWTATASGTARIDTSGSDFDTLLAVYVGSSLGTLERVAENDDAGGGQSRVMFPVTEGTEYRIAVDGYGGATGAIVLRWDVQEEDAALMESRTGALGDRANLLSEEGDLVGAMAALEEQAQMYRELGDLAGVAGSFGSQATLLYRGGDVEGAMARLRDQEGIYRDLGDLSRLGLTLGNRAVILYELGESRAAMDHLLEQERISREIGDVAGVARSLGHRARILSDRDDLEPALELLFEQSHIYRELGDASGLEISLGRAAAILGARGDLEEALTFLQEREQLSRRIGNSESLRDALSSQARILEERGERDRARAFREEEQRISVEAGDRALEDAPEARRGGAVDENVQFTVYRPRAIAPDEWYDLLAFAHLSDLPRDAPEDQLHPVAEVQKQARQVLGQDVSEYQSVIQDSREAVPREGELTFVPEVRGVEFNPPRRSFRWLEAVHREDFRLRAEPDVDGQTLRGRLTVFLGCIILADIPLTIRVDSDNARTLSPAPTEAESARPYRKIFASYSHRDDWVVAEFEERAAALALGDEYMRDVNTLRVGEIWSERLEELIRDADIFQLFWSWNSMASHFVEKEWRYALGLGRPVFVRPVYWEEPLPKNEERRLPPEELERLHFQRVSSTGPPATPVAVPVRSEGGSAQGTIERRRNYAPMAGPGGAKTAIALSVLLALILVVVLLVRGCL